MTKYIPETAALDDVVMTSGLVIESCLVLLLQTDGKHGNELVAEGSPQTCLR